MDKSMAASISIHFSDLEDPRVERTRFHPLINIVVIGICAVISGAQGFTEMEEFGNRKGKWLAKFLDLSHGVPSHDTFNKVFARLKPEQFEKCLLDWITSLQEISGGQILAIDGKTLRGSYDRSDGRAAIHMVSVWATANKLSLVSRVVDEKTNEITAIPELLDLIDINKALITIDAMGCQKEIAKKICDNGGEYVLAVKDNQPKLHEAISDFMTEHAENDYADVSCHRHKTEDKDHGRLETREYYVVPIPEKFPGRKEWRKLRAVGVAFRTVERNGETTDEVQYYICSRHFSGRRFAEAVRGHWGIENQLHWQLDVTFREDDLRIRKGHAAANMSVLMRHALALLKRETSVKRGMQTKRMSAGWDESYLEKVLLGT